MYEDTVKLECTSLYDTDEEVLAEDNNNENMKEENMELLKVLMYKYLPFISTEFDCNLDFFGRNVVHCR